MRNRESDLKLFRIDYDGTKPPEERFTLSGPDGAVCRIGPKPKPLNNWAFANDADEFRWDFDLKLAENL